eukprot:TRINITY_DN15358_c0_g1_i1.p1 TRINITY_DN15358_c0_g1~~TRINITY_DN15358_c0_g1_i1.p1  ORF type:complete len:258 (-),score=31.80 TRINITY_DN15358_c0_g1_i1:70-843(-)
MCIRDRHRFWRDTSLGSCAGSTALMKGLIGHEFDEVLDDNGCQPAGLARLSLTELDNVVVLQGETGAVFDSGSATHSLTQYRASSGALVFGAGTCQWSWGLDGHHDSPAGVPPHVANPYCTRVGRDLSAPDTRVQQATVNLFADMRVQPMCLPDGLLRASPPKTLDGAPISEISDVGMRDGTLTIQGTAVVSVGVLVCVEVWLDGRWVWCDCVAPTDVERCWEWCLEVPWDAKASPRLATLKSRGCDDRGVIESTLD